MEKTMENKQLSNISVDVQIQSNGLLDLYLATEGSSGAHYEDVSPEQIGVRVEELVKCMVDTETNTEKEPRQNDLIKKIEIHSADNSLCDIYVVTDKLTFVERDVEWKHACSSVDNYKACTDGKELYTHMLYVRLFGEYEKRVEWLTRNLPIKRIINEHSYELAGMQEILYVLEEKDVPVDRALELLELPGDLMEAIFATLQSNTDSSGSVENIIDTIIYNIQINAIAQRNAGVKV